ncbi:PH domain-containing protein [Clostridium pasteurianum]|uniref:PH domain-containing protein n=1 Tax=Clostridium pasteurianum TaxID=1501 RepID=UPI002260D519|nr:PH domain-containing protein [Clostridium pasteurianum]UZW15176.1 PH domain-containing protein [Clostridium pasteurianum]
MNRKERNHFLKLFYDLGDFIRGFIGIVVAISFLINKIGFTKSVFIIVVLVIAVLIYKFLSWRKNFFIIKENSIYHEKGILSIKKIEIPFERINTIDISQRFLERIFKAATIKIDTGDTKNSGSELKFTLNKERAEELRDILLKKETDTDGGQQDKFYTMKPKGIIIYSLISNSVFKGIGMLLVAQQFFDEYLKRFIKIDISQYGDRLQNGSFYYRIYVITSVLLVLVFISVCLSIIYNFLKYYDFKMWTDNKKIYINYGAISKKSYSFDKEKVKGIHIKQSILMQCFGFFTMEIENIGYGDEKGEKAILYPICSSFLKNEIIENLLGEFKYSGIINKPKINASFRFFYKKVILWAIIGVICFFIRPKFVLLTLMILLFFLVLGYLEFRNTAFGMDKNLVYMGYNSFNKTRSILKMTAVQSVTLSRSYFQRRRGFCDYIIILYSSTASKVLKVKNLKDDVVDEVFR